MMDLHSLIYFKKVAERQHLTRAAEELRVAQPSLSRTIAALEADLGVKLFDRVGKGIVLNRNGAILLRRTNNALRELEDARRELADQEAEENRTVTVSLFAASKLLPQLISAFKEEYPHIRLQIVQHDLQNQGEGERDIAIFSSMQPAAGENQRVLIKEELLLALPEGSPLASRRELPLSDAADQEFICLHKGKSLRTITDLYCQMAGFSPKVVLECDSPETVRELICAGMGISFVPSITWRGMDTRNIVLCRLSAPDCKRYINLSWRKKGYLSPAVILFRDFVQDYFAVLKAEADELFPGSVPEDR